MQGLLPSPFEPQFGREILVMLTILFSSLTTLLEILSARPADLALYSLSYDS